MYLCNLKVARLLKQFFVPSGKTIYIAIAPGEKNEFNVHWMGMDDSHARKRKHSAVTFEAGKIYNLGNTSDWTTD